MLTSYCRSIIRYCQPQLLPGFRPPKAEVILKMHALCFQQIHYFSLASSKYINGCGLILVKTLKIIQVLHHLHLFQRCFISSNVLLLVTKSRMVSFSLLPADLGSMYYYPTNTLHGFHNIWLPLFKSALNFRFLINMS